MIRLRTILLFFGFSLILFLSCSNSSNFYIQGSMDYVGSSEIYLERQPLHYKYAPKRTIPIAPDDQGNFEADLPVDSTEIIFFTIGEEPYPVVARPGESVTVRIQRAYFPDSVTVEGYTQDWNELYAEYRREDQQIEKSIDEEMPAFRNGEPSDVLELYKNRIVMAKRYLGDTPLDLYYHKAIGEYLVKRLENITYRRGRPNFNPEEERQAVVKEAREMDFFTFEVLKNQRAGIRDFTNAYANTFGVEEMLEDQYGQDLMQYDVKRLGYETMDSARTSVLNHIDGRRALAYSKMHLIAERIGEMSPDTAEPSYRAFLEEYKDYPKYTSFLRTFYQEIKSVTPGQPAVPFELPNQNGEMVAMSDFRGTYVLLDFWAVWCTPCLDEFPYMNRLYDKYSRSDFEIVAISIEEDSLKWRDALDRFNNPWVQVYGGNGFDQETFNSYRGGGIPFYILVDREGNIERYNDIRPSFNLEQVMDSLLAHENNP